MSDLLKEFFERDLSPAEEAELERQLKASEIDALRFSHEAGRFYAALGAPVAAGLLGHALASKGGVAKGLMFSAGKAFTAKAALVASLTVAGSGAIWYGVNQAQAPAQEPVPAPAPVMPAPAPQAQSGDALAIRLDLPSARELSVRVVDAQGREVRVYERSLYAAGTHRILWDGRDQEGHAVQSGKYTVEVDYGSGVLRRALVLAH